MAEGVLRGCRLIVTRPEAQAEELAQPLRAAGAEVRVRPLVRLAAPADGGAALRRRLECMDGYDWVVFTSANAVRACLEHAPANAAWPAVACVGPATAAAARGAGLTVASVPETFTGEALAGALAERGPLEGRRVLWPRASAARETVGVELAAAGAAVDAVDAYATVEDAAAGAALHEELRAAPADLIVFTSPSGVRAFAAAGAAYAGEVAVIGTVTAAAAAAALRVAVVPAEHTVAGLVAGIEAWCASGI